MPVPVEIPKTDIVLPKVQTPKVTIPVFNNPEPKQELIVPVLQVSSEQLSEDKPKENEVGKVGNFLNKITAPKEGGTFVGNLLRGIGINKSPVPTAASLGKTLSGAASASDSSSQITKVLDEYQQKNPSQAQASLPGLEGMDMQKILPVALILIGAMFLMKGKK